MIFGYCEVSDCTEKAIREAIIDHLVVSICYKHIEEISKNG